MKRPGFLEGVLVAFVIACFGAILHSGMLVWFSRESSLRLLIVLASLGYVVYLLRRSRLRTGRVTAMSVWALASLVTMAAPISLSGALLVHSGLLWLVRSRYQHGNALMALMDLGLVVLGLAAAVWAAQQSGSLFLTLWSFFLVQALFVYLPSTSEPDCRADKATQDPFSQAYRSAQLALRRLSLRH